MTNNPESRDFLVNVWLLESPEMVLDCSLRGGRVIFITEDIDPRLQYIPNKLSAKILLPPYEATEAELDGNLELAFMRYYQYLSCMEPADYISVLLAAAVQGISIGLYFGPELKDMHFPKMFIEYLYNKGLVVGYKNTTPMILASHMPFILTELYGRQLIAVDRFMTMMPIDVDIPEIILPKLVSDLRPPTSFLEDGNYNKYFKNLIKEIHEAGKYLVCPIVEPGVRI